MIEINLIIQKDKTKEGEIIMKVKKEEEGVRNQVMNILITDILCKHEI